MYDKLLYPSKLFINQGNFTQVNVVHALGNCHVFQWIRNPWYGRHNISIKFYFIFFNDKPKNNFHITYFSNLIMTSPQIHKIFWFFRIPNTDANLLFINLWWLIWSDMWCHPRAKMYWTGYKLKRQKFVFRANIQSK